MSRRDPAFVCAACGASPRQMGWPLRRVRRLEQHRRGRGPCARACGQDPRPDPRPRHRADRPRRARAGAAAAPHRHRRARPGARRRAGAGLARSCSAATPASASRPCSCRPPPPAPPAGTASSTSRARRRGADPAARRAASASADAPAAARRRDQPRATSSTTLEAERPALAGDRLDPDHVGRPRRQRPGLGRPGARRAARARRASPSAAAPPSSSSATSPRTARSPARACVEHMVDTVLYFEGERGHQFRILRAVKNRFGPTDEIGVFEMTGAGLAEVAEPLGAVPRRARRRAPPARPSSPASRARGRCWSRSRRWSRRPPLGTPRRAVVGWDAGRLAMILAVLEARCGVGFAGSDVYSTSPAACASPSRRPTSPWPRRCVSARAGPAAAAATRSSSARSALSGALRPIAHADARLREAAKLGFAAAFAPAGLKTLGGRRSRSARLRIWPAS